MNFSDRLLVDLILLDFFCFEHIVNFIQMCGETQFIRRLHYKYISKKNINLFHKELLYEQFQKSDDFIMKIERPILPHHLSHLTPYVG